LLRGAETAVQTLHLYGAAGIVAFGWALCRLLGCPSEPWMPLWLCAALLLYNVDRLRRDPADQWNTPKREAAATRLRRWSWFLVGGSALGLMGLPLSRGDWLTLTATVGGALFCLNYSLPVRGFRLKNIPLLKTFFAPTLVIASVFGLPVLHGFRPAFPLGSLALFWAWGLLFCNMLLCDLRDVEGDRRCGVVSVPTRLGERRVRGLLWGLVGLTSGAAVLIAVFSRRHGLLWLWLALTNSAYISGLILAVCRGRSERFYEWCVEGVLFVPALTLALYR
jgi:4-hydroxybenzoate polyprenyltransferase